jgi:SAM-dependent methyltransferase
MPHDRKRSLLELGGVALLLIALTVLVYRDYEREAALEAAPRIESEARRKAFEAAYGDRRWATDSQGKGTSGEGSTLEATKPYRAFLQDFLVTHGIRSVVDAGCGDWEFSQAMDWTGIDYLGLDIVPAVIAANRARFGKPGIRFAVADIVRDPLPAADLLIVKDVLQHLPDSSVDRVLAQLPRYRHVLIVNDVELDTLTAKTRDAEIAAYRPLDVTRPPYSVPGAKVLAWRHGHTAKLVVHVQRR